jgi:drug/metabolite transporter (DMT)-like permease
MSGPLLAGLAAGALWGVVFVAPKVLEGFAPFEIALGRYAAYGAVCAVIAAATWPTFRRVLTWRNVAMAVLLAALSNSVYYALVVLAVRDAGVAPTSLAIGTIPLWLAMLGRFEAHVPQPPRMRLVAPLVLIGAGIGLINVDAFARLETGEHFVRGASAALAALVCWTAYPILNARFLKRHRGIPNVAWTNLLGLATVLGLLPVLPFVAAPDAALAERDGMAFVLWCAVMGFGSSWLATWLWNHASSQLPVSLAGQLIVSETLFALAYGFALDARWPSVAELAAIAAFTAGIVLAVRAFIELYVTS